MRPEPDATPPADRCGAGPRTLELGTDRPFVKNPEQKYQVEEGNQGGFHIHVSLRVRGRIDPDDADIELRLNHGDHALGEHVTADWLLTIEPDGCHYPLARIVLLDEGGGLLPEERLPEVTGVPLRLAAGIETPEGGARAREMVTLLLPAE